MKFYLGNILVSSPSLHHFKEAVFLSPKVYGIINSKGELTKVKGLKNPVSFSELKSLLEKNKNITVSQEKWYKNIELGHISIKNELYNLIVTENKRELIFKDNLFIDTKPLIIKEIETDK